MNNHQIASDLFAYCVDVIREGGEDSAAIDEIHRALDNAATLPERDDWVQSYAERILISWCANPQMFAEGAHVPYSSLLINARELASLAWVMRQKPCADSAELRTEAEYAGLAISESMFPEKKGGHRGGH